MKKPATPAELLASAIAIHRSGKNSFDMNAVNALTQRDCGPLDRVLKSDFQSTKPPRSTEMARAKNNKPQSAAAAAVGASLVNNETSGAAEVVETPTDIPEGYTHSHNPTAPAAEDKAAAKAQAKAQAKTEEKAAKLAAKLAKADEKAVEQAAKKEARAQAKADREAKLAELADGKSYTGSMLALAERVKSGAYVKSATGQLRSNDELAITLDTVPPGAVVKLAKALEMPGDYSGLNMGQQSMNYRNRMRGAIKKGTLTLDAVKAKIAELDLDAGPEIAKRKAAAEAAKSAREAAAEAKKTTKAVDAPAATE